MNRIQRSVINQTHSQPITQKIQRYFLWIIMTTLLLVSSSSLHAATPHKLLLQPLELRQKQLNQPKNLVIIDTRTSEEYIKGHIPTAISLPIDQLQQTIKHIKKRVISPLQFQQRIEALGLKKSDHLVFYSGHSPLKATQALWTFELYGHPINSILDGGFPAWKWQTLPIETTPNKRPVSHYTIDLNPKRFASKFYTLVATHSDNTLIIDARSRAEFNGLTSKGKRSGHIPTAVNLDFSTLFKPLKTQDPHTNISTFIDTEQFTQLLTKLPDKQNIILYCNAGSEASALYFSFRLMDKNVAVYDGSWEEWSADPTLPVALHHSKTNNDQIPVRPIE